ncbi:MAG: hypothetical protein HY376_02125 [Candidatus Blackburnbacteria bacterium]|nr:hypothetical protein [Candidatus Blackburnbacteria bacterium]
MNGTLPINVELLGTLGFLLITASLFPQLIKTYRRKEVGDVSLLYFSALCVGVGLLVVYGWLKQDWVIFIGNAVNLAFNSIMLSFIVVYGQKDLNTMKG